VGAGLCVLLVGGGFSVIRWGLGEWGEDPQRLTGVAQPDPTQIKQINTLKALPPEKRKAKLEAIAKNQKASLEGNRARYLLATELMQQGKPQKALESLDGLETDYPLMAAHVVLKRAQSYEQMGDGARAAATWQELLKQHPQTPVAAEALVALGRDDPRYGDRAIAQFPAHPRTVEVAQQRLKQNPNQPQLLLLVARHGLHLSGYIDVLDRLVQNYGAQLQPQDWEAIAFGYWEKQQYGKAGAAYTRAPYTPRNAYRIARGLQLGERGGATVAYQRMVSDFPNAQETPLALIRLSRLVSAPLAVQYLDQVVERFPNRAGEALLEKAKVLDAINSRQAASQVRQLLLTKYRNSNAAAELRWTLAEERATARDFQGAMEWAAPILAHNRESEYAPEAGFWVGKWANQLGKRAEAKAAFEQVLKQHPQSYYAWRSASMLGWEVGDFYSVRQFSPAVQRPETRPQLPVGSETLKELYQLGQDRDAWRLWQVEFQNPMQPSVAEQFADGVLRMGVGDYVDGIFMVSFLSERELPEEKNQYRELKHQRSYWQALYPFPFLEPIESWSQERQLNPLLVTALIRQESRFMPGIRSVAGATGLMQVMPDTGMWIAQKIKLKEYKLEDPEDNIKLGTWYLDYTHQEYDGNSMLAIASYNAGPGAVGDWVAKKGVGDPDAFVETIPYNETRVYVKSVFENYWNYLRLYNPEISEKVARISNQHPKEEG
jgi:soluble lytic murein transglycosylase